MHDAEESHTIYGWKDVTKVILMIGEKHEDLKRLDIKEREVVNATKQLLAAITKCRKYNYRLSQECRAQIEENLSNIIKNVERCKREI